MDKPVEFFVSLYVGGNNILCIRTLQTLFNIKIQNDYTGNSGKQKYLEIPMNLHPFVMQENPHVEIQDANITCKDDKHGHDRYFFVDNRN